VELVRYLWAADRVLPAKAKLDKKAMKENIVFEQAETEVKEDSPEADAKDESKTEEKSEKNL
jgi:hypothetical protein